MQTLDYEMPRKKRKLSGVFWPAFVVAYFSGMCCISLIQDEIAFRRTGNTAGDPGEAIFSLLAFPFFLVIGIVAVVVSPKCRSLWFAIIYPLAAPFFICALLWAISMI
jgi:hypothetical protein